MFDIEEVNDPGELERLRPAWASLLGRTPRASFFQSLDWLLVYWKHFGAGQRLRVLVAHDAGVPVGIVPLVVQQEVTRLGQFRTLKYPLDDWGPFYGPIGPWAGETLAAAFAHITNTDRDWDILDLEGIDHDRADQGETGAALAIAGFAATRQLWNRSCVVDLRHGWSSYWNSRDSKFRNGALSSEKKLAKLGQLELIRFRPDAIGREADPDWQLYDACEELAARSWQNDSQTGTTLTHPEIREFLRDAHAAAAAAGCVDVAVLTVDEKPVAFYYNYFKGGRVQGLRMGYDPEYPGAGAALLLRLIRDSAERGDHEIDLGTGSFEVKKRWLTALVSSYRYVYYRPVSPRAQLLRVKRSFWGVMSWDDRSESVLTVVS